MNLKRSLALALSAIMLLFSVGCNSNNISEVKNSETTTSAATTSESTVEVETSEPLSEDVDYETPITIYTMYDNPTINEAIIKFKALHPDAEINTVVAYKDGSPDVVLDQIRALNAEILAGNGADIFVLDVLNMDSYIEKDILLDMSDFLLPMVGDGKLLKNISNKYVNDGKIYGMPIQFSFPVYVADENSLKQMDTIENLKNLVKNNTDKNLLIMPMKEVFFSSFIYPYYGSLLQEDGNIDKEKYQAFLENLKEIYNSEHETDPSKIRFYQNFSPDFNTLLNSADGTNGIYSSMRVVLEMSPKVPITDDNKSEFSKVQPINNRFQPSGIVGINNKSKNTALSKEFIKFLFSDEFQKNIGLYGGLPVNVCAYDNLDKTLDEGTLTPEVQKEIDDFKDMISKLDTPIEDERFYIDIFFAESMGFFYDTKSSEDAANDVYKRLSTYILE